MKKKLLFTLVSSAAMLLTACGGGNTSQAASSTDPASVDSTPAGTSIEAASSVESKPAEDTSAQQEASSAPDEGTSAAAEASSEEEGGLKLFKDEYVTEDSIVIHYFRLDDDYSNSSIWLWKDGDNGAQYFFNYYESEHNEHIAVIPLSGISGTPSFADKVGIIFRAVDSWAWQTSDLMVNLSEFDLKNGNSKHIYFMADDETPRAEGLYVRADAVNVAKFISDFRVRVETSNAIDTWKLYENGTVIHSGTAGNNPKVTIVRLDDVDKTADLEKLYEIEVHFVETDASLKVDVSFEGLYGTAAFNNKYAYAGDDLGVTLGLDSTTFKVWSPLSSEIKVRVYSNGTPESVDSIMGNDTFFEIPMTKGEKGVFSAEYPTNLAGNYYTYVVTNKTYTAKEIVDPYAKSAGVNGERGMIIDLSSTNPEGWDAVAPIDYDRKELAVYETHLVDPTSSSTWTSDPNKKSLAKTYQGFIATGTTYTENEKTIATGYDHIKSLGVNAVQLQPIFDQDNDEVNTSFNWGYNPLNYNVLEGSYSSNPFDGAVRVREFKELVKKLHEDGMNVIMDVVYNHVSSVNGRNFDVLMPKYYFRYDASGKLSNGSGCGNETASDRYMYSKFMKDSALFWAKEYKLGGFRFDLMGLHDLETMNSLTAAVKEATYSNFCIYGEPWTGGASQLNQADAALQANIDSYQGYGSFNDLMRDGLIKSGMNSDDSIGWADVMGTRKANTSDANAIANGVKGYTSSSAVDIKSKDPDKAVQYASCHDNYTLWDRISVAYSQDQGINTTASADLLHYGPMLANGLCFLSQGTSFMLSGEEFLRTKTLETGKKDKDSYKSSYEVNALDYALAMRNQDVIDFYKKIIALKTNYAGLHLGKDDVSAMTVNISSDNSVISYALTDANNETYKELKVFAKNGTESSTPFVAEGLDGYKVVVDSRGILETGADVPASVTLSELQFLVVGK